MMHDLNTAHTAVTTLLDGIPLSVRMLIAADAIEELNARFDFGPRTPWEPTELRHEAAVVASEEPQ